MDAKEEVMVAVVAVKVEVMVAIVVENVVVVAAEMVVNGSEDDGWRRWRWGERR